MIPIFCSSVRTPKHSIWSAELLRPVAIVLPEVPHFNDAYMARVSGLILETLLCACFSPGESCLSDDEELVEELRLGKIFDLSSCAVEEVLDFVIIDASSERV
jgi:hypothetical protein